MTPDTVCTAAEKAALREQALATPLDELDVSHWDFFQADVAPDVFARLRREAPVHYCRDSQYGPYWSITLFEDLRAIEIDWHRFSSARSITLMDQPEDFEAPMFIAMDPPKHDEQRKVVRPSVAPMNLRKLEGTIRERAAAILDSLPVGDPFDWVDRVSIELTTQMLATLFDFPLDQSRRLTRWSDVTTGGPQTGVVETFEQRREELRECLDVFTGIWHERAAAPPASDLISMLAHADATRDMVTRPMELLGNVLLLIVGGNDTTRNSISGGVWALDQNPAEVDKLRADPGLIPNMVSEIIRWQTPLAHMRRTTTEDVEIRGQKIGKGEKVALWYVSANRDAAVFENGDDFVIDRPNAKHHLAFGFGIHRCMGAHLAEMQLRVLWEEIMKRFDRVEVLEEPVRTRSNFVRGYKRMPVRVHPR
jgi:cytochrome P450